MAVVVLACGVGKPVGHADMDMLVVVHIDTDTPVEAPVLVLPLPMDRTQWVLRMYSAQLRNLDTSILVPSLSPC